MSCTTKNNHMNSREPRHGSIHAVTTTLAALALVACGGGGGGTAAIDTAVPPVAQVPPEAVRLEASKPGALLTYVQQKLNLQIDQGLSGNGAGAVIISGDLLPVATSTTGVGLSSSPAAAAANFASTTLQEGGVDEADLMKTDGKRIFSLTVGSPGEQRLTQLRVKQVLANGSLQTAGELNLGGDDRIEGLHLSSNAETLAVVGRNQPFGFIQDGNPVALSIAPRVVGPLQTVVNFVSAKPGQPLTSLQTLRIDGQLIDTRTIGDTLYVVTSWVPTFDQVFPTVAAPVKDRKEAVTRVTNAQVLPTITIGQSGSGPASVSQALMADTDCQLQAANASTAVQLTTITAINLASPTLARSSRCLLGGVNAVYMSTSNLYLATSRYDVVAQGNNLTYPGQPSTDIHKFAVNAQAIAYRGSGNVSGHLGWEGSKTSYRLSEHQNDLRVVTHANSSGWLGAPETVNKSAPPSPARLTVLREDAATNTLKTIATLPNSRRPEPIGLSGEQVYAVRFLGARAYVVTFRRTDPLYVVDLADPLDPKVTGELKTNGYSDYLLPVGAEGSGLLLGVGKDATLDGRVLGVKVSLFDVSNAAAPKELASHVLGKAGSLSGLDFGRHGISLFNVANGTGVITRVALPVRVNETLAANSTTTNSFYRPSEQSLARFEVNTVNKTLTTQPSLVGVKFATDLAGYQASSLEFERSVQIGSTLHYLNSQGVITSTPW